MLESGFKWFTQGGTYRNTSPTYLQPVCYLNDQHLKLTTFVEGDWTCMHLPRLLQCWFKKKQQQPINCVTKWRIVVGCIESCYGMLSAKKHIGESGGKRYTNKWRVWSRMKSRMKPHFVHSKCHKSNSYITNIVNLSSWCI